MSYHEANSQLIKELHKKKNRMKMMKRNQQTDKDFRNQFTELQKEMDVIKEKYSDLESTHKYMIERNSKRIWELLHRPVPSIQRLHDLERSLYDANKLVDNTARRNSHLDESCQVIGRGKDQDGIYCK